MTTSLWCLFVVAMIPYILAFTGGYFRHQQFGLIDNKHPRQQIAQLEGVGARAYAAQQNAWEALLVFAAALFVANAAGVPAEKTATLSVVFVIARILHAVLYLANLDALRSLAFLLGWGSAICLFVMGA